MNRLEHRTNLRVVVFAVCCTALVATADYDLSWWTVDGGGAMQMTGGAFELSGTIGQPDASPQVLTGGGYELTGGFWAGVSPAIPPAAALVSSNPATEQSLWRSKHNIARLTFDADIAAPGAGEIQIQEMLTGGLYGADLSSGFKFTVEDDAQAHPRVLRIWETDTTLQHRKWYAVRSTGAWAGVNPFVVQYVVQVGDANADRRVLNTDFGVINAVIPVWHAADDDRRDINGDGRVLNTDFGVTNSKIPSFPVAKPAGH